MSKTRVCLINPPVNMRERLWYPIGIGYIASSLLNNGFDVEIIDCIGDNLSRKQCYNKINEMDTSFFGIGGLIMGFNNIIDISLMIRETHPDSHIFAGNTCASTIPGLLLKSSEIDTCVMWEGEQTIVDLVNHLKNNKTLTQVDGLVFKNKDKIHKTKPRNIIPNLDTINYPAWELLPMKKYFINNNNVYPISTVRGCPYHCTFCLHLFMNSKTRFRSPNNILNEMLTIKEKYNIKNFMFMDDIFTINKKNILSFCEQKNQTTNLDDTVFSISGRVNIIDKQILSSLENCGCSMISFGFESMSQKILDWYNKNQTVEQIKNITDLMSKHDMVLNPSWMVGAENETRDTIKLSHDYCKEYGLKYNPHFVTPYPQTELYNYAKKKQLITNELSYIKQLSQTGHTNKPLINFTNIPTKRLIQYRDSMVILPKQNKKNILNRIINSFSLLYNRGWRQLLYEIIENVKPTIHQKKDANRWN